MGQLIENTKRLPAKDGRIHPYLTKNGIPVEFNEATAKALGRMGRRISVPAHIKTTISL